MKSLSNLSCQNKKCPDYGKRKSKNLAVCGWHGINNHIRLLYCRTCKSRFSEIQNAKISGNRLEKRNSENLLKNNTLFQDFMLTKESLPLN